jgi:hypothetical protein
MNTGLGLSDFGQEIFLGLTLVLLFVHVIYQKRSGVHDVLIFGGFPLLVLSSAGFGWWAAYRLGGTDSRSAFLMFIMMIVFFFVLLGESMYLGLAKWLTRRRGDKWVKEIDYIYLIVGIGGVLASINRMDAITERVSGLDWFGPIIVAFAIALRLTKTRAEINEWHKDPGLG